MTTEAPPKFYFNDIIFNSEYYQDEDTTGFSQDQADLRYLKKNITDTATALETFSGGIKTNSIEPINDTDTLNIATVSTTATNVINIGNTTTNEQTLNLNSKTINMGDTSVPSAVNILSTSVIIGNPTSGTISFGSSAITTQITPSTSSMYISNISPANGDFNLCLLQVTGILNIGTATGRTAAINIGTGKNTSSAQTINIGSSNASATGQIININRPLNINYLLSAPTTFFQMGYTTVYPVPPTVVTVPLSSTTKSTIQTITSLPAGIYMISMGVKCVYTTTSGGTHCDVDNFEFGLTTDPLTSDYLPCLGYKDSTLNTVNQFNSNNIFNCSGILKNTAATTYYFTILATFDKVINTNPFINITRIG
jgi:hypothetical protein